jgi:hypothetical protein
LLALVFAVSALAMTPVSWPWRRPDRVRNTAALVLVVLAFAVMTIAAVWRGNAFAAAWRAATTLIFASTLAETRRASPCLGWLNRVVWGGFTILAWWGWRQG